MIVLDTHIWVWWVHGDAKLPSEYMIYIQDNESAGLASVLYRAGRLPSWSNMAV